MSKPNSGWNKIDNEWITEETRGYLNKLVPFGLVINQPNVEKVYSCTRARLERTELSTEDIEIILEEVAVIYNIERVSQSERYSHEFNSCDTTLDQSLIPTSSNSWLEGCMKLYEWPLDAKNLLNWTKSDRYLSIDLERIKSEIPDTPLYKKENKDQHAHFIRICYMVFQIPLDMNSYAAAASPRNPLVAKRERKSGEAYWQLEISSNTTLFHSYFTECVEGYQPDFVGHDSKFVEHFLKKRTYKVKSWHDVASQIFRWSIEIHQDQDIKDYLKRKQMNKNDLEGLSMAWDIFYSRKYDCCHSLLKRCNDQASDEELEKIASILFIHDFWQ